MGYAQYAFNPEQSGCLYWQLSHLQCLEMRGYLAPGEIDRVKSKIETHREEQRRADYIPWPPV